MTTIPKNLAVGPYNSAAVSKYSTNANRRLSEERLSACRGKCDHAVLPVIVTCEASLSSANNLPARRITKKNRLLVEGQSRAWVLRPKRAVLVHGRCLPARECPGSALGWRPRDSTRLVFAAHAAGNAEPDPDWALPQVLRPSASFRGRSFHRNAEQSCGDHAHPPEEKAPLHPL